MGSGARPSWAFRFGQVLGALILAGILYILYLLVSAGDQTRLAVLTAGVTVGTLVYTQNSNARREIDSRHFARKSEAYEEILRILNEFITAEATGKKVRQPEIVKRLADLQPRLLIWAGPKALRAWQLLSEGHGGELGFFNAAQSLIAALREELGHSRDSELGPLGLAATFLKPEARAKLRESGSVT